MDKKKIRRFRKAVRKLERLIDSQEKNCCGGVSLPQCHVLLEIEELGQTTTGQLSESLDLDKSTLSRTIDGLVTTGQLKRLPNPSDRRYIPITLTEQGQAVCDAANSVSDDYYARVLERIPLKKIDQVIENFEILVQAFLDYESKLEIKTEGCNFTNEEHERKER